MVKLISTLFSVSALLAFISITGDSVSAKKDDFASGKWSGDVVTLFYFY